MSDVEPELGLALALAARDYIGERDPAADVAAIAGRWSIEGWFAVARARGLEPLPTVDDMRAALAILSA